MLRKGAKRRRDVSSGKSEGRLPAVVFLISCVVLSFLLGIFVTRYRLPPARQINEALQQFRDFRQHWRNDLGLEPTRLLVDASPGRQPLTVHDAGRAYGGLRVVAGLAPGKGTIHGARLLTLEGRELHFWPVDYSKLDPTGRDPENTFLHGLMVLRDGSIVVNFDGGAVMARIDACGEPLWITEGAFHHLVSPGRNNTVWSWEGSSMAALDLDSGAVRRSIPLKEGVIFKHGLHWLFGIRTKHSATEYVYLDDPIHANDVEELTPELAAAFPQFAVGDLLVSMRSLNLVAVLDGSTHDVKWWQIGPWHRQHDADFLPDGTISVFNNNMGFGASSIVVVDPASGETRTVFASSSDVPFYSWRRGNHQHLGNGNILIVESERGRVFEVTGDGQIVWEFHNVYDEDSNGVVNLAVGLDEDYFEPGAPSCEVHSREPGQGT